VKLIDCRTGRCVRVLTGHRRTPWVVRFHPSDSNVLVSGSLDHQVRVWNATSAECILCFDFGKPIASLAFNAAGDVLAVASGHKLYAWRYRNMPQWDERRASRDPEARAAAARDAAAAVAAHEDAINAVRDGLGARNEPYPPPLPPFIATFPSRGRGSTFAGDTSGAGDVSFPCIALRTRRSLRAVHFHPHGAPLLLTAEVNETSEQDVPPLRAMTAPRPAGEWEKAYAAAAEAAAAAVRRDATPEPSPDAAATETATARASPSAETDREPPRATYIAPRFANARFRSEERFAEDALGRLRVRSPGASPPEASSNSSSSGPRAAVERDDAPTSEEQQHRAAETAAAMAVGDVMRQRLGHRTGARRGGGVAAEEAEAAYRGAMAAAAPRMGGLRVVGPDGHPARDAASVDAAVRAIARDGASSAMHADTPCTVKLRVWPYDASDPHRPLTGARLTIPHAVLCSEMGAHFSPCGRLLAVCAACVPRDAPAPTPGEPIPNLVYELRIYSLEERNFGEVLAARAVRAAHCLTSIQFSPTSEHVLLAYGRRHSSLLLLVADGGACVTVHTILEVYRCSDMRLVRALPSAEDEVNVACFHPSPGGGVAYGTKEGRLRILRHDRPGPKTKGATRPMAVGRCLEDELLEVLDWSGMDVEGLSDGGGSDTD
jgi:activator-of-BECN1-regulated-autophagy protein 1